MTGTIGIEADEGDGWDFEDFRPPGDEVQALRRGTGAKVERQIIGAGLTCHHRGVAGHIGQYADGGGGAERLAGVFVTRGDVFGAGQVDAVGAERFCQLTVLGDEGCDSGGLAILDQGGIVLYLPPVEQVKVSSVIGFSSIFWNTAWTKNQEPHTLGILCDPQHPLFAHFPTESHSNWQWWELIHGSAAMQMDSLPAALRPLVQPIDTWFENRRLGLLFEAKIGNGRLMVSSMDLASDLDQRLVARQMHQSLVAYMESEDFAPGVAVTVEEIKELLIAA